MKIGGLNIKYGLFLAPMAGITDYAFRILCREQGAECTVTEMISSKAVHFKDKKTNTLAHIRDHEQPTGLQIFGSDPDTMAGAAYSMLREKPAFIDINMGCPVKKVTSCGDGSALMGDPSKCGDIVKAVCRSVDIPVTVKIRSGIDSSRINAAEVAKACEQNGASAIFVHGRTAVQMYSGKADRAIIKAVKNAVSVPVIGNGDVDSAEDAAAMLDYTGVDGLMIGRGALGDPWIFPRIISRFSGSEYKDPSPGEKAALIERHIDLLLEDKGSRALVEMRKHLAWYMKGVSSAAKARYRVNGASSKGEFMDIIHEFIVS